MALCVVECFGYPNTYMESQPCNLQVPCHMQLDKNRAEISAHAHCSWNLPSIHSSALNNSFLLAYFVLVLALPCPSSELSQIDKPAENQLKFLCKGPCCRQGNEGWDMQMLGKRSRRRVEEKWPFTAFFMQQEISLPPLYCFTEHGALQHR